MKNTTRSTILFAVVLFIWHALFFALTLHYGKLYMGDSWEYVLAAYNLLENGTLYSGSPSLPVLEEYMTQRTPLYPAFLAVIYALGGSNWTVIFLQGILSVFSLVLLRQTLFRLGYKPRHDWLLLLLLLTFPPQFIHAMWIEPEVLLQLFTLLYFHYWIRLAQEKRARHGWMMTLWLILGLFTKPVLYPFVIVHALLLLFTLFQWQLHKIVMVAALLPVGVVLLYNQINASRTGKAHFSSNQAFNALYYAYPFYQQKWGADSAAGWLKNEREEIASLPRFADRYALAEEKGRDFLRKHWQEYLPVHLKGSTRLLIDPGKADMDLFTGQLTYGGLYSIRDGGVKKAYADGGIGGLIHYARNHPSLLIALPVFLFNVLRVAGLGLFLLDKKQQRSIRFLLFFLVLFFAGLAGPIAVPRYLLPVWSLMAGAAALGWSRILDRRSRSRARI